MDKGYCVIVVQWTDGYAPYVLSITIDCCWLLQVLCLLLLNFLCSHSITERCTLLLPGVHNMDSCYCMLLILIIASLFDINKYYGLLIAHKVPNFCGQKFLWFKPIFVIHYFVILELSSRVYLRVLYGNFCGENFCDFV